MFGGVLCAHADQLLVAGQTVNLNASGTQTITGSGISGTITYSASEKMLTLQDATINCSGIAISANVTPGSTLAFRVYLSGNNKIKTTTGTPVRADNDITFCGNGRLDIEGPQGMFINQSKLTVYACRVSINSTNDGIYGWTGGGNSDLEIAYHGALHIKCAGTAVQKFNTIKYTTGTLLSGSLTGKEVMLGDNYNLEIGGVTVTPFNRDAVTASNISGSVSVSLVGENASGYTGLKVALNNATISGSNMGIDFNDAARTLTVSAAGTNKISATTRGITGNGGSDKAQLSIEGSGKLTVNSATCISHQGDVSIKDVNLELNGSTSGVSLWSDTHKLTVDNATVNAKSTNTSYGVIYHVGAVEYKGGCMETVPLNAVYNSSLKGIADGTGSSAKLIQEVKIEPTYGVIVCGVPLTKAMGSSTFTVTGDGIEGNVQYNPSQNVLSLNNASLKRNGYKRNAATILVLECNGDNSVTGSSFSEFSIYAEGDCNINHSQGTYAMYAIHSYNDLYFFGGGRLNLNSTAGIRMAQANKYIEFAMSDGGELNEDSYNAGISGNNTTIKFTNANTAVYRIKGEVQACLTGISAFNLGEQKILSPSGASYNSSLQSVAVNGTAVQNKWLVIGKSLEDYGLKVFGTAVTNANANDPGDNEAFSYDASTKTLNVYKTVSSSSFNAIENNSVDGLTVNFVNNRTLSGSYGLYTNKNTTVTSSVTGLSQLHGNETNGCGIYVRQGATVTIKNMRLETHGYWSIASNNVSSGSGVKFVKADVNAKSSGGGCVVDLANIEFDGCYVKTPAGAKVQDGAICNSSGTKVTDQVVISSDVTAIDAIEVDSNADIKTIFDAAGRQQPAAKPGLNIIRMSDGSVRKVMVK